MNQWALRSVLIVGMNFVGFASSYPVAAINPSELPQPIKPAQPDRQIPLPLPKLPNLFPSPDPLVSPESEATPPDSFFNQDDEITVILREITVDGSTVFKPSDFEPLTQPYLHRPLTFSDLLELRTAITRLFIDQGYITSGAYLPAGQILDTGHLTIQVLEGQLDEIQVLGLQHLRESYIRDRLQHRITTPLNIYNLLEALRFIQLDPLTGSLSAELTTSEFPGLNTLVVNLTEAQRHVLQAQIDNFRSKNIGKVQGQLDFQDINLTGRGDRVGLNYSATEGSHDIDFSYQIPINAQNSTLSIAFNQSWNRIVLEDFDTLRLTGSARRYRGTFRHPLETSAQQGFQELALGGAIERLETQTRLDGDPFQLSPGANEKGQTQITQFHFFQEWLNRTNQQVFALRSNLGFGVGLPRPIDDNAPDRSFLQWQGQAQWVKQFSPDTLLLTQSHIQLANDHLATVVQKGLGGAETVRGYPQDLLLNDNGLYASVEGQIPILRTRDRQGVLQFTPFVDYGYGWNWQSSSTEASGHLIALGVGMKWQWSDRLQAKLDWGIPLLSVNNHDNGLGGSQVFFSIRSQLF